MTVEEIKAKVPEAEVFSLSPDAKYIILVRGATEKLAHDLSEYLKGQGLDCIIVRLQGPMDETFRLLEVK